MQNLISNTFSIGAQKESVSIDHIENFYLTEATGSTPAVDDSRWRKVAGGGSVPVPTSSEPFLWHKYIVVLTDGSKQEPIIEFKGSLGKNGIDYDLVPSHTSIVKHEDGSLAPDNVSCKMIMRNADGTAQNLTSIPSGYSIIVMRDAETKSYALGSNVSTANANVVSFILKYGNVEVERHDIRVITEGAQGIAGRGIQSQDIRFKALAQAAVPAKPTNNNEWNVWQSLAECGYSASKPYLYKCVKTVFVDGNNNTSTEYYVEGPTVWGQDGKTPFVVDIDNEMTAVPLTADGRLVNETSLSFNVAAHYGTEDVTNQCEVSLKSAKPSYVSKVDFTKQQSPVVVLAANSYPAGLTELTFAVKHASYGTREVVFSITTVKAGSEGQAAVIYQLLPSASELSVARTDSGDYNPSSVSLKCGYTKRVGNAAATSVEEVTEAFDGYNIYFRLYNRSSQKWSAYFYRYVGFKYLLSSIKVATYSKVEFYISTDSTNYVSELHGVIDHETIPIIADGLNGSSPFTLNLSSDMTSVALTYAGVVERDFSEAFSLKGFYGSKAVGISSVSVEVNPSNSNLNVNTDNLDNIKVEIAKGYALADRTEIKFTVNHDTYGLRSITHTLAGVRAGADGAGATIYELLPDMAQVAFSRDSNNNLTPSSRTVNVSIKKTVADSTSVISIGQSPLTVKYSFSSMPESVYDGDGYVSSSVAVPNSKDFLYIAAFNGSKLIDKETIPVVKDGAKGQPGGTGNGISDVIYQRMLTMNFEAPSENDGGWRSRDYYSEADLSKEKRYLWEKRDTYYTDTPSDCEIYLVAQFSSSPCANLLENTAFLSDNEMEAWEEVNGSVLPQASTGLPQNGWQLNPELKEQYVEMLKQVVRDNSIKKIKPNTWYTLSFYAAQANYNTLFSGSTYNGEDNTGYYQIAKSHKSFRIEAGQTVKVRLTGRVYNSSYGTLRAFVWLNSLDESSTWIVSKSKDITSTTNTTVEIEFTNNQSSACMCHVAAYMLDENKNAVSSADYKYRGYCTAVTADRGMKMDTYLYRSGNSSSAVSTSEPWYVDGKKVTSPQTLPDGTYVSYGADGNVRWKLNGTGTRHSVTFKTSNFTNNASDVFRVLFRLTAYANYGWVSMPKLEENTMATEWMENSNDRYATAFQHMYVGVWKASTSGDASTNYLYALGVRHVVRAKESASGSMSYFRLKERTPITGYCSLTEPYLDTTHWEKANYLKFVAADLVLADEVITDKLTVSKIKAANDHFTIDAAGNVVANGGTFRNINIMSGDDSGQRVEINPDSKNVAIFDSSNNQCTSIDGNSYSLKDLIPSVNGSKFTLTSAANRKNGVTESLVIAGGPTQTYQLTDALYTEKPCQVKMDFLNAAVRFYFKSSNGGTNSLIIYAVTVQLFFVVKTYSDSACTKLIDSSYSRICDVIVARGKTETSQSFNNINTLSAKAGYHKLFAEVRISASGTTELCELTTWWNFSSVNIVVDSFISRYFANGLALSKNNLNYIALYEENGYMNFAAASNGRTFNLQKGTLTVDGAAQPIVVYAAKVTDNSTSKTTITLSPVVLSQITSGVTVVHSASEGIYNIMVPSTFGVTTSNVLVRATGYGSVASGSQPVKAQVMDVYWQSGSLMIRVRLSDDDTPNYGGFYIEILRYG